MFAPFQVISELGKGATAVVYEVEHPATGLRFALKHLVDASPRGSLKHEFRIARSVSHPHVVLLHELSEVDGQVFFTMELVRGQDLVTWCRHHPDGVGPAFRQLADAVDHLHHAGLVHRDLKPQNVLVDAAGRVVLLDFGLVRRATTSPAAAFSGSPLYAAPERLRGAPASAGSDWYGFGVVLLEALTGAVPSTLLSDALRGEPPVLPPLPAAFPRAAELLRGLLEPDPVRRFGRSEVFAALGGGLGSVAPPPLLGRRPDVEWLRAALGEPGLSALVGPAGTGKSSLVRYVVGTVGDRPVLHSRCHPRENVPFNALDGVWADLVGRSEAPRSDPPRTASDLAAQLVDHLRRLPAPPVIWIDDAQWADEDSVHVLADLLSHAGVQLTVVVTIRGAVTELPAAFPRPHRVRAVEPLDAETCRSVLTALSPDLEPWRADALLALSAGRPLWLERAAAWARTHPGVPERPADLLLGVAASAHLPWLGLLAVHPPGLELEVLAAGGHSVVGGAWDLVDAGLVDFERSGTTHRMTLRHHGVAEVVLAAAPPAELLRWHRVLAEAFAAVRPGDAESRFLHLVAAGREAEAIPLALPAARQLRERVALHAAAERFRWSLARAPDDGVTLELAQVLGRAGDGAAAGMLLEALARGASTPSERHELQRLAAEQFLCAGAVERGRALLATCLADVGVWIPGSQLGRILLTLVHRLLVAVAPVRRHLPAWNADSVPARLDAAWSAGLGLNLVDVTASSVAQGHFTSLALARGTHSQRVRATAVEYSFGMLVGLPGSASRGERLRSELAGYLAGPLEPYDRGLLRLSHSAGDWFRGSISNVAEQARSAARDFAGELGVRSWEITNCEMYALWAELETLPLPTAAPKVPEALQASASRGDRVYRQCFVAGPCSIAWLALGRADELDTHLDDLAPPAGPFGLQEFLQLVARHHLDLYRGEFARSRERLRAVAAGLRASGMHRLRWLDVCLCVLRGQSSLHAPDEELAYVTRRLRSWSHPLAAPWADALAAAGSPTRALPTALEAAADGFAAMGCVTTAGAFRHQVARLRGGGAWSFAGADHLADALAVPLSARHFAALRS